MIRIHQGRSRGRGPLRWGPETGASGLTIIGVIAGVVVTVVVLGFIWKWFFCRIEVPPDHIAVLVARTGDDLPDGQIIATKEGQKGIQLKILQEGRYFRNPVFWNWNIEKMVDIPKGQFGVQVSRYGRDPDLESIRSGQVTAREGEKGILKKILKEGKHPTVNPYATHVEMHRAITIPAGFVGVVTNREGGEPKAKNEFLVEAGEKGVLADALMPGKYYLNPYVKGVDLVDVRSQRYELFGDEALRFPSSDGFTITVRMVLEWAVVPGRAPEVLVRIGELHDDPAQNEVLQKVVIPMLRGFGRIEGSKYPARDYISGESRLTFQNAVLEKLRAKAAESGIIIKSLLVNEIEPPQEIAQPIREREIAKEELSRNKQQVSQAKADQRVARQEALVKQEAEKVQAQTGKLQQVIAANNRQEVALIEQEKLLKVANTDLDAAKRQATAILARGKAEADVVRFERTAEADVLRKSVGAFTDGASYARYEFYRKVAPRIESVFANTDGAFGKIFEDYVRTRGTRPLGGK